MSSKKILILAAVAAMSVGIGSAVAQESAGGVAAGPFETRDLKTLKVRPMSSSEATRQKVQYGSSDASTVISPVLQAADGNGG